MFFLYTTFCGNSSYWHESLKLRVREIPIKSIRHTTLPFRPGAQCRLTQMRFFTVQHTHRGHRRIKCAHKVGIYCFISRELWLAIFRRSNDFAHSEKKVVPATRNFRTNSVSTMYYKVVITTMNK